MKYGKVIKSLESENGKYSADIMAAINKFSRKTLTEDEVYVFPVVMCDNEIDRTFDKFDIFTLKELGEKFIGRTVICDHQSSNANQKARIFMTEVKEDTTVKTRDGENLNQLIGYIYMLNNESNSETIENIDGGIYKEVSVSCTVQSQVCSVCGKEYYGGECMHIRGTEYQGKLCYTKLMNATDAYELSFVAVPAQPGAGIIKWYNGNEDIKKNAQKGLKEMTYDELSKSLGGIGIDLAVIAKDKSTIPELPVIMAEVTKKFEEKAAEPTAEFISADVVKDACGKNMTADEAVNLMKSAFEFKKKAALYDTIKASAIENACKSGVKAKGETFDGERYKKIFASFSVDEINAQSKDWEDEAKITLKAGIHASESDENKDNGNDVGYTRTNYNF